MPQTEFTTLTVGKKYEVFGMSLCCGGTNLLLADDVHLPRFFPVELFTVVDPRLPEGWFFRSLDTTEEYYIQALWGYERLVMDENYHDALLEYETENLQHFYEEEQRRLKRDDDEDGNCTEIVFT